MAYSQVVATETDINVESELECSTDQDKAKETSLTKKKSPHCKTHSSKKLKLFCRTCSELVCIDCTKGVHKDHDYDLVEDVFAKNEEEIVKENLDKVNAALDGFNARANEIKEQRLTVEADINKFLEQQKAQLVSSLELMTQQNLKTLQAQKDYVQVIHDKMSTCWQQAKGELETETKEEVPAIKVPVLQQLEQIAAEFDPVTLQPQTEADIKLVTDITRVSQACKAFGEVVYDPISVEDSHATECGSKYAQLRENATAEVIVVTRKKKKYERKVNLEAEIVHTKTTATIKCEVKHENDTHTITYQPTMRGKHSLHIRINGKHIRGSPYPIAIIPSQQSLVKPVRVVTGLKGPHGTATNSMRQIIVAEAGEHRISILTSDGRKLHTFSTKCLQKGQLWNPQGVVVDRDDNIYVVDKENNKVQKFTSEGEIATTGRISLYGYIHTHKNTLTAVAYNQRNNRLCVCDSEDGVQLFSTTLTSEKFLGKDPIQRWDRDKWIPKCVAFDNADNIYLTDYDNNKVQVFTFEGNFLRSFSKKANSEQLEKPYAIAIDSSNAVYVSEDDRHCVSVFSPQGDYITSFGTQGSDEGQFNTVSGLSVDQNDSIIVSDHGNDRLQIY